MSENNSKSGSSAVSLIATAIVAVLAIVLAVLAILSMNKNNPSAENSSVSSVVQPVFHPTQELVEECTYAAHDLVKESYDVVRLFVSEGLPHYDEPYGNAPEDGLYTVNSTDYSSLEDIEALVKSIFINSEAERIMSMGVYKERRVLVDIVYDDATSEPAATEEARPLYEEQTVLGISADFVPDESANEGWESCSIAVLPKSETECELTIYLGGIDGETSDPDPDSVLETAMVKIDGAWKLAAFVY